MDSKIVKCGAALSLALAFGLAAPAALAGNEPVIREKRVVVINDDGKVFVNEEGDDAPGVRRGYIGVQLVEMTDELRGYFGVANDTGVLVSEAVKGSPAEKAGIRAGDVIVAIDGKSVSSSRDIGEIVREHAKGETVKVDAKRKGTSQQFLVTVGEREMKPFKVQLGGPAWHGMKDGELKEFQLDSETLGAIDNLQEYFESPAWKMKLQNLGNCDEFEKKIDDLEKRLQQLEKQLKK